MPKISQCQSRREKPMGLVLPPGVVVEAAYFFFSSRS